MDSEPVQNKPREKSVTGHSDASAGTSKSQDSSKYEESKKLEEAPQQKARRQMNHIQTSQQEGETTSQTGVDNLSSASAFHADHFQSRRTQSTTGTPSLSVFDRPYNCIPEIETPRSNLPTEAPLRMAKSPYLTDQMYYPHAYSSSTQGGLPHSSMAFGIHDGPGYMYPFSPSHLYNPLVGSPLLSQQYDLMPHSPRLYAPMSPNSSIHQHHQMFHRQYSPMAPYGFSHVRSNPHNHQPELQAYTYTNIDGHRSRERGAHGSLNPGQQYRSPQSVQYVSMSNIQPANLAPATQHQEPSHSSQQLESEEPCQNDQLSQSMRPHPNPLSQSVPIRSQGPIQNSSQRGEQTSTQIDIAPNASEENCRRPPAANRKRSPDSPPEGGLLSKGHKGIIGDIELDLKNNIYVKSNNLSMTAKMESDYEVIEAKCSVHPYLAPASESEQGVKKAVFEYNLDVKEFGKLEKSLAIRLAKDSLSPPRKLFGVGHPITLIISFKIASKHEEPFWCEKTTAPFMLISNLDDLVQGLIGYAIRFHDVSSNEGLILHLMGCYVDKQVMEAKRSEIMLHGLEFFEKMKLLTIKDPRDILALSLENQLSSLNKFSAWMGKALNFVNESNVRLLWESGKIHGFITQEKAVSILSKQPAGSYIIRFSDDLQHIWGLILSYIDPKKPEVVLHEWIKIAKSHERFPNKKAQVFITYSIGSYAPEDGKPLYRCLDLLLAQIAEKTGLGELFKPLVPE